METVLNETIEIFANYTPTAVPTEVSYVLRRTTTDALPPINIWCDFISDFSVSNESIDYFSTLTLDIVATIDHEYVTDKVNATPRVTCANHVSSLVYNGEIKLQQNFTNVILICSANAYNAVRTSEDVEFSLYIINGSHADITIDHGDGTTETISDHNEEHTYVDQLEMHHTYSDSLIATVEVFVSNFYFNTTVTLPYSLVIQNIVQGLTLDYNTNILLGASGMGETDITVTLDGGLPNPTNVSCNWDMGSGNNVTTYSEELSSGLSYVKTLPFLRDNVGLANNVSILCYNLVSSQKLSVLMNIYEEVIGISFVQPPLFAQAESPMSMQIFLEYGSHVSYVIDLGNGEEVTYANENLFGTNGSFVANLTYSGIGNFTPSITAFNILSESSATLDNYVTVQNVISDLYITVGNEYIWPPGIAEYEISVLANQKTISNMHCYMSYNSKTSVDSFTAYEYVNAMNALDVFRFTYAMSRPLLGNTTLNATCGNMISNTTIHATTLVTLDAVILYNLTTNESVLWSNTTVMIVDITRFGTNTCFQFNMGDKLDFIIYGSSEYCDSFAVDVSNSELYKRMEPGTMIFYHEYIYRKFGKYNVTVLAFNHVSNDSLTTEAEVLDWPCIPPNITFPGNKSDADTLLLIQKSVDFVIVPDVYVECMKTWLFTNVWELYVIEASSVLQTQGGEDDYVLSPEPFTQEKRILSYGTYKLVYTASMFNVTPAQTNYSTIYFEIVSTPLEAAFEEGNNSTHLYDTIQQLDFVGASFDLDVEPFIKTGMTFTWLCRRSEDKDVTVDSSLISLSSPTYNLEDKGGCFGQGRGKLDVPSNTGVLTINTYHMLPNTTYIFDGYVYKDDRESFARHVMKVSPSSAPVISLR